MRFEKGQRKEEVAQAYRRKFTGNEGVLFIGKAQEKARVVRTERRRNPQTGASYAWLVASTAMVNHYYFYAVDEDFGPLAAGGPSGYSARWRRHASGGSRCS